MNIAVSFNRSKFIANVKKIGQTDKIGEDNYFETNWEISLYKDSELICYTHCNTQYDLEPAITDVVEAISNYYNSFCIHFAKYGKYV